MVQERRRKRPQGTGSIVLTRGAYHARLPASLGRAWLPPQPTYELAELLLDGQIADYQQRGELSPFGDTWSTLAHEWRDLQPPHARNSYVCAVGRVCRDEWTREPVNTVTRADMLRWVDAHHRQFATNTVRLDVSVVSLVFSWGVDRERCIDNPARRIRLTRKTDDDPWTYLTVNELDALLCSPKVRALDKAIIRFWAGTGLRPSEWRSLRLDDVTDAGVRVRIGRETSKGAGPTKGRRIRRIPWLPIARRGWEDWQECRPARNPRGLAFPGAMGGLNHEWTNHGLRAALDAAGIVRPFRPHDLRHSCGAALASGYFGHAWRLELIRDFLGHASITETQRYAHLAHGSMSEAASQTGDFVGHKPALVGHGGR